MTKRKRGPYWKRPRVYFGTDFSLPYLDLESMSKWNYRLAKYRKQIQQTA